MPDDYFSVLPGTEGSAEHRCSGPFLKAFLEVAEYAQSPSMTIDNIVDHLETEGLIDLNSNTPDDRRQACTFVFGVLGWQTMLYKPSIGNCPPEQFEVVDEQSGYRGEAFVALKQQAATCVRKQLQDFLMGFGVLLPKRNICLSVQPDEVQAFDQLMLVNPGEFNSYLLSSIGHVRVKWVDTMSCHMEFDRREKELYLFRFPSFCLACLPAESTEDKRKSVIYSCAGVGQGCRFWAKENEITSFLREILLSYRLLFGQDKRSRALFRSMDPFAELGDIKDPLLPLLSGVRSPQYTQISGQKEIYDLSQDFPILRSRIVALHTHLSTEKPRGWSELWNDKRNSAQWLTFWAVIIFGGLGVFFAFLQVVLQILQVALGQ